MFHKDSESCPDNILRYNKPSLGLARVESHFACLMACIASILLSSSLDMGVLDPSIDRSRPEREWKTGFWGGVEFQGGVVKVEDRASSPITQLGRLSFLSASSESPQIHTQSDGCPKTKRTSLSTWAETGQGALGGRVGGRECLPGWGQGGDSEDWN